MSKRANIMTVVIRKVEAGGFVPEPTLAAIRTALEAAGVEFIVDVEGWPGVRLRSPALTVERDLAHRSG